MAHTAVDYSGQSQDLNTRLDDRIDNHIELNEFIGRNNA